MLESAKHKGGTLNQPQVSIIIAAYNAERFLSATLQSIRAQTFTSWECIVVDDGSTDKTVHEVEKHSAVDSRIRVIRQSNSGPAAARNRGLEHVSASSRYFTFMDSDDVWVPEALEKLTSELSLYPEVVAVHGLGEFIDEAGKPLAPGTFSGYGRTRFGIKEGRVSLLEISEPSNFDSLAWTSRMFPPGLLLGRRTVYEAVGGFDSICEAGEDRDMVVRLSRHGNIRLVDSVVIFYRRHSNNVSQDLERGVRVGRYVTHKAYFSVLNTAKQRRSLQAGWRAWQRFYMKEHLKNALEGIRGGRPASVAGHVARFCLAAWRFLRGYPTVSGI